MLYYKYSPLKLASSLALELEIKSKSEAGLE